MSTGARSHRDIFLIWRKTLDTPVVFRDLQNAARGFSFTKTKRSRQLPATSGGCTSSPAAASDRCCGACVRACVCATCCRVVSSLDFSAYDDMPYHKLDPEQRKNFFESELGTKMLATRYTLYTTLLLWPRPLLLLAAAAAVN